MRSSTVLILSLKTVAHEIIKNLVLAGIGRLIVMDNGVVTEEDLGSGFLFREEEGAVGQEVCRSFFLSFSFSFFTLLRFSPAPHLS
jgi:molybdopterin/thiamine biosynthesis adenylyltransferase